MMLSTMVKMEEISSYDDLVVRARTESNALAQLYTLYHDRIYRFCMYRLFTAEAAEDVTSEVFLAVARKIQTFRGDTEQEFRNWLYSIAAIQANAYIRKTKRRNELFTVAVRTAQTTHRSDHPNHPDIDWDFLYQALQQLKPRHQNIIIMRFVENMSHEQIAAILGLKNVTVRVSLNRALAKLRKILKTALAGDR